MDQSLKGIKDLNINGTVYAKYLLQSKGSVCFIHLETLLVPNDKPQSEDLCLFLIRCIEKDFIIRRLAYLNI